MSRCNFSQRPHRFAELEAGCPLDHCPGGHHIDNPLVPCQECIDEGRCSDCGGKHDPKKESCEEYGDLIDQVARAEAAAGWDSSP